MKAIIQSLLLISLFISSANAINLKSGDIILQSNACYLCGMIEAEENSPYSHMGILVLNQGVWSVLEAWGKVKISSLTEFSSRRKKDTQALVLRVNEGQTKFQLNSNMLMNRFEYKFEGLAYDAQFLWNNSDVDGEKLYCSEFVAKFMHPYLINQMPTKPMHFDVNREFWVKYFHGNPPDGEPGISPGDFQHSPLFHEVGVI